MPRKSVVSAWTITIDTVSLPRLRVVRQQPREPGRKGDRVPDSLRPSCPSGLATMHWVVCRLAPLCTSVKLHIGSQAVAD